MRRSQPLCTTVARIHPRTEFTSQISLRCAVAPGAYALRRSRRVRAARHGPGCGRDVHVRPTGLCRESTPAPFATPTAQSVGPCAAIPDRPGENVCPRSGVTLADQSSRRPASCFPHTIRSSVETSKNVSIKPRNGPRCRTCRRLSRRHRPTTVRTDRQPWRPPGGSGTRSGPGHGWPTGSRPTRCGRWAPRARSTASAPT
jgi:hypothetical protein